MKSVFKSSHKEIMDDLEKKKAVTGKRTKELKDLKKTKKSEDKEMIKIKISHVSLCVNTMSCSVKYSRKM